MILVLPDDKIVDEYINILCKSKLLNSRPKIKRPLYSDNCLRIEDLDTKLILFNTETLSKELITAKDVFNIDFKINRSSNILISNIKVDRRGKVLIVDLSLYGVFLFKGGKKLPNLCRDYFVNTKILGSFDNKRFESMLGIGQYTVDYTGDLYYNNRIIETLYHYIISISLDGNAILCGEPNFNSIKFFITDKGKRMYETTDINMLTNDLLCEYGFLRFPEIDVSEFELYV